MAKKFIHAQQNETPLMYERRYMGGGKYEIRGIFPSLEIGDELVSFMDRVLPLKCVEILSREDSAGIFSNNELRRGSHVKAVFVDEDFKG